MPMLAVQVVLGFSLTICFGLASRDNTFNGNTFCMYFLKIFWAQVLGLHLGLGFMFRF